MKVVEQILIFWRIHRKFREENKVFVFIQKSGRTKVLGSEITNVSLLHRVYTKGSGTFQ